jgi:hypothetical protein
MTINIVKTFEQTSRDVHGDKGTPCISARVILRALDIFSAVTELRLQHTLLYIE